jgi:hypothetical protein
MRSGEPLYEFSHLRNTRRDSLLFKSATALNKPLRAEFFVLPETTIMTPPNSPERDRRGWLPVWRLQLILLGYTLDGHAGSFDPEPSKLGILFKQRQNAFGVFVVLVVFIAPN